MATRPDSETGGQEQTTNGEIVVATAHLGEVLAVLGATAQQIGDPEPRLGLARVGIDDLAEQAARFAPLVAAHRGSSPTAALALNSPDPLDLVLAGVRLQLSGSWAGWYPVMGKNRDLPLGGEGWPYTITGGPTFPQDVTTADTPYAGLSSDEIGPGGTGRVVGLLDTPIAASTPGVTFVTPQSALEETGAYSFRQGHGTFLAGLIRQYAPDARIHARAVLMDEKAVGTSWDVAVGLLELMKPIDGRRPDFVVLALGCVTRDGQPPLVLQRAVDLVRDQVVLVAASGNHGEMSLKDTQASGITRVSPMWPAALDGVVAVGGVGRTGGVAGFTPRAPWVDLLAPGEALHSTFLKGTVSMPDHEGTATSEPFDGGFAEWSGTSMSAAIAAARLACVATTGEPASGVLARVRSTGTRYLRPTASW